MKYSQNLKVANQCLTKSFNYLDWTAFYATKILELSIPFSSTLNTLRTEWIWLAIQVPENLDHLKEKWGLNEKTQLGIRFLFNSRCNQVGLLSNHYSNVRKLKYQISIYRFCPLSTCQQYDMTNCSSHKSLKTEHQAFMPPMF